jgi:8-amino-7-oxononanoate synthase
MAPSSSPQQPARRQALAGVLRERLRELEEQNLRRELRWLDSPQGTHLQVQGRPCLNFASNDYLGLANHPFLKEVAVKAVARDGAGAGASRLVCGSLTTHRELEEALADFKGAEAALTFGTGYAAMLGTITALVGREDVLVVDRLVHACIVDGARLSGAKLRVFRHNDLEDLERILRWADGRRRAATARTMIVTESVFSMDGDQALLGEIVDLKEKYGAWLMVDEAHATGLYGIHRRGLAEELGVQSQIEVQMGTLGKALGAAGGYICGSRVLIDYLVNRARSLVFSTAPVPAAAGAASAGIELVRSTEGERRRKVLWERVGQARSIPGLTAANGPSAILPLMVGHEAAAVELSSALLREGIFAPAIRYPTVGRGKARLRLTLSADHTEAEVTTLGEALRRLRPELAVRG